MTQATAAVQTPVSLKTLNLEFNVGDTVLHVQLRNLTPIRGEMEVTNTGTKVLMTCVTARLEIDTKCTRTLAADHVSLKPGESRTYRLGVMMPGCVSVLIGDTFDTATEIVRLPSPGGIC